MKIEILSVALVDIQSGQHFYEQQQEGLGAYFLDSLFSDIDALYALCGYSPAVFRILPRAFETIPIRNLLPGE